MGVGGAEKGFLYLRGEYPLAYRRFADAIAQARAAGLLGENVAGGGFRFEVEIRRGAGAYICGEETALFNSIEGRRGEPRSKPPFPTEAGLFGRPTLEHNFETLFWVRELVEKGPVVRHSPAFHAHGEVTHGFEPASTKRRLHHRIDVRKVKPLSPTGLAQLKKWKKTLVLEQEQTWKRE